MSFHQPPGAKPEDPAYVSISDEAFLVTLWENYFDCWVYMYKKSQFEEEEDERSDSESTEEDGKQKKSLEGVNKNQDPKADGKGSKGTRSGSVDKASHKEKDPEKEEKDKDPVDPDEEEDPEAPQAQAQKPQLVEVKCP